jgi:hypothetical protein
MLIKLKSFISTTINKIKAFFQHEEEVVRNELGEIEHALPVGLSEFKTWADTIVAKSKAPDNDSTRWTLAAIVLELKHDVDAVSHEFMLRRLNKAMANQVASAYMYDLKQKQAAEEKARKAAESSKNTTEATVLTLPVTPVAPNQTPVA